MLVDVMLAPQNRFYVKDTSGGTIRFWMHYQGEGPYDEPVMEQMPWTYTANGKREDWKAGAPKYRVETLLGEAYITQSQTVTFHLGQTVAELGGPQDVSFYVPRSDVLSVARVTTGATTKRAVAYVNVNGVWKQAEAYTKHAGVWKQTT